MGKSYFVRQVDSPEEVRDAIRAVITHNATPDDQIGVRTPDEAESVHPGLFQLVLVLTKAAEAVDSGAARTLGTLVDARKALASSSLGKRYRRGGTIELRATLIPFCGRIFFEVGNTETGASTTEYFERNFPEQGWYGTRGKPRGIGTAKTPRWAISVPFRDVPAVFERLVREHPIAPRALPEVQETRGSGTYKVFPLS